MLVLGEDSATSSLPPGVMAGLKTMRELERALITVQPAKAFGATGDASRGVPPESVVAYEMTVHRIIEINTLEKGARRQVADGARPELGQAERKRRGELLVGRVAQGR